MQKRSVVTGKFLKRFKRNQTVQFGGKSWRVCKDVSDDWSLGFSSWDHTYYKIQRGADVRHVRADYLKTKKQVVTQVA